MSTTIAYTVDDNYAGLNLERKTLAAPTQVERDAHLLSRAFLAGHGAPSCPGGNAPLIVAAPQGSGLDGPRPPVHHPLVQHGPGPLP